MCADKMINIFTYSKRARSLILHFMFCALVAYALENISGIPFIGWWFIVINIFEFLFFGKDKLRAKQGWSRTPESTFLIMGLLGAFPAILIGRKFFKHKTTSRKFILPMWTLFIIQIMFAIAYIEQTTVKGKKFLDFLTF
ncbi:MAG: uncharacterized membrane protein YsdA (DUF1294 family) [Alphaproteobacteria bacterium]